MPARTGPAGSPPGAAFRPRSTTGVPRRTGRRPARGALPALATVLLAATVAADEVVLVPRGTEWRFLPGLDEASSPERDAWTRPGFDDSGWRAVPAPVGFGEDDVAFDLAALDPPMEDNYQAIFLRTRFEVEDPGVLRSLELDAEYDDGMAVWLNGVEVLRVNLRVEDPDGPPRITDSAARSHEGSGRPETLGIDAALEHLVPGENVLAVEVFNQSDASGDLWLDLRLLDPLGPDRTAPKVVSVDPAPDLALRQLSRADVLFDEPVRGVDAGDLIVAGRPALEVRGDGAGPYRFIIADGVSGDVRAEWAEDHGISDRAPAANAFAGEGWTWAVDPAAPLPDVAIVELLGTSLDGPPDEDGDRPEWIEIRNREDVAVSLEGFSLTDDRERPGRWVFPAGVVLEAGERRIVFASGKDRRPGRGGRLHTDFRLAEDGEFVGLYSADRPRRLVSAVRPSYPPLRPGVAWGLIEGPEGPVWSYLARPTPGAPNDAASAVEGFVEAPRLLLPHGVVDGPRTLDIICPTPGAEIRYTLDGSEPGPESPLWDEPLRVEGTPDRPAFVVRARAFREGLVPSPGVAGTWVFPEMVARQPARPEGFPGRWGGATADYAMDPRIAQADRTAERMRAGLRDLPTVSIQGAMEHIFGPRGIYSNSQNEGFAWERPAAAELIHPDGRPGFTVECGLRIQGGASRIPDRSPKHSFRLLFKALYGPKRLEYPLFPDSPVRTFDTVTLRARYNNSWIHNNSGQRSRAQYIRDQFIRDVLRDMGRVSSHGRYVHLFVNGVYWGVHNMVERPSAPFAADHLGGEKEEYDALNSANPVDGDSRAWRELMSFVARNDLRDPQNLRALEELLDLENFADYMLANFYGANHDWPHHNWYAARRRDPPGPWRFFSWDAERVLEGLGDSELGANDGDSPGIIFQRLRRVPEFQLLFADRVARHLFGDGPLAPGPAAELWETRARRLERALIAESARWGDYRRPQQPYAVDVEWTRERRRLLATYFPRRPEALLSQLAPRNQGLWPSLRAPVLDPAPGLVGAGDTVTLAPAGGQDAEVWYTTDGTDPRVPFSRTVAPAARRASGPVRIDETTRILARAFDGTAWSPLRDAVYTVLAEPGGIAVTEVHYRPATDGDHEFVEIAHLGDVALDIGGFRFTEGIRYAFPARTVLRPGERRTIASDPLALRALRPDIDVHGKYQGRLDGDGERLTFADRHGRELVSFAYDDDGEWPAGPDGLGWSLVLADPELDPDDPAAWRASAERGGSPGEADPPGPPGGVVISEILPAADPPREAAVELLNRGPEAVDASGWWLSHRRDDAAALQRFRLGEGTVLAPGERRVLYAAGLDAPASAAQRLELSTRGGVVYLAGAGRDGKPTGYVVAARYGPQDPGGGVSFGRHATSVSVDFTALERPTFGEDGAATVEEFRTGTGAANAAPRVGPVVLHEIHYHPAAGGAEFVELRNLTGRPVELYDARSGRGWLLDGLRQPRTGDDWEFRAGTTVPADGLLLLVQSGPGAFRARRDVPEDVPVIGPFGGALANEGETLRLLRPVQGSGAETLFAEVDRVRYDGAAPWPPESDGRGPSLERTAPGRYGNDPAHWAASAVDGGTPGRGGGPAGGEGGGQVPGDLDQDGRRRLPDAVMLLGHLFRGEPASLPCGDGSSRHPGNVALLDATGDGGVELTDAVALLEWLFRAGPAPPGGTRCREIAGCPDVCTP